MIVNGVKVRDNEIEAANSMINFGLPSGFKFGDITLALWRSKKVRRAIVYRLVDRLLQKRSRAGEIEYDRESKKWYVKRVWDKDNGKWVTEKT